MILNNFSSLIILLVKIHPLSLKKVQGFAYDMQQNSHNRRGACLNFSERYCES